MRVTPPGEPDGNQYAGARGRSGLALLSGIEAERLIVSELLPNTGHDLAEARCIAALVVRSPRSLNAFMQERKEISLPQRPLPANIIRQLLHFAVDDEFNKTETAKRLGPPVRGGGGMPQRIVTSSMPLLVLRITGAG